MQDVLSLNGFDQKKLITVAMLLVFALLTIATGIGNAHVGPAVLTDLDAAKLVGGSYALCGSAIGFGIVAGAALAVGTGGFGAALGVSLALHVAAVACASGV
jgi:hypothetical protein